MEWIKCSDRLPEEGQAVKIKMPKMACFHNVYDATYERDAFKSFWMWWDEGYHANFEKKNKFIWKCNYNTFFEVTHWAEIELPTSKTGE